MNIKTGIQLFQNMGIRYVGYRIVHEFEKRCGILKRRHPVNPSLKSFLSLSEWKNNTPLFFYQDRSKVSVPSNPNEELKRKANKILNGEICFFSNQWYSLGKEYDWITNPESGYKYDIHKHWSEISDLNPANGDIKYVWEKSRFTFLLTIIRFDHHFNEDNSEFVFAQIESWINANPINQGPNWLCSQEISLRVFNWCFALYFYKNSPALNEERWKKIQNAIYWQIHHVYHHIDFSRIAVRNNHAITETLLLTLSELLFPFIPQTRQWAKDGRKWFEQEIAYQIYEDGTFLQFSMNYHRVVVQLLSFGIASTDIHKKPFSKLVTDRAYKSLEFLYHCMQDENGNLPNYGANDGALFFPLTENEYRDYRPQLNTLHRVLCNQSLYPNEKKIEEDAQWLLQNVKNRQNNYPALFRKQGFLSFPIGGYYLIRDQNTFTFIRCGNHKDRPSHADNLHLDVWKDGVNILRDSGTYKYNTDANTLNYFTGSTSHNTVSVENKNQMLKGSRFIWFYWTQAKYAEWKEENDYFIFKGGISAFRYINEGIIHHRTIKKQKNKAAWIIEDAIEGTNGLKSFQNWHFSDVPNLNFTAIIDNAEVILPNKITSFDSPLYGLKKEGNGIAYKFQHGITTTIKVR